MNLRIGDGKRSFALTRFVPEPGKPPCPVARPDGLSSDCRVPLEELWDFAFLGSLAPGEPEPGTPAGQIVIRAEYETLRETWYCDPAHDFIVARRIIWSKEPGGWVFRSDDRAVRWKQLPGGSWYVAARERRTPNRPARARPLEWLIPKGTAVHSRSIGEPRSRRCPPDRSPRRVFDGEKLLADGSQGEGLDPRGLSGTRAEVPVRGRGGARNSGQLGHPPIGAVDLDRRVEPALLGDDSRRIADHARRVELADRRQLLVDQRAGRGVELGQDAGVLGEQVGLRDHAQPEPLAEGVGELVVDEGLGRAGPPVRGSSPRTDEAASRATARSVDARSSSRSRSDGRGSGPPCRE